MSDASVPPVPASVPHRWPEMAGLVGGLVIRAVGVGIAAASLLVLGASVLA